MPDTTRPYVPYHQLEDQERAGAEGFDVLNPLAHIIIHMVPDDASTQKMLYLTYRNISDGWMDIITVVPRVTHHVATGGSAFGSVADMESAIRYFTYRNISYGWMDITTVVPRVIHHVVRGDSACRSVQLTMRGAGFGLELTQTQKT